MKLQLSCHVICLRWLTASWNRKFANNSSHLLEPCLNDVGSEQLPGWQAGGITPLSGGIVGDVSCRLASVSGTVE